ncbi:hypothetical protein Tco_1438600 [Tanacetum coccineum]
MREVRFLFLLCLQAGRENDSDLLLWVSQSVTKFCRYLCQHHVPSAATAAIVFAVCQANDHGFGGLGGFSALGTVTSFFERYNNLFPTKLNPDSALDMVRHVTSKEVKDAIFSMGNDNSNRGYHVCVLFTAAFFKEAWDIIAEDVTKAIQEFFVNGCLLK